MFNWFKSKSDAYIPKDINEALLTSDCFTIKLNTRVGIPNQVVCYASYKDKIYCEKMEELAINKENLGDLIEKQNKKTKSDKIDLDLFFVNTNEQEKSFTFKDKISIESGQFKVTFKVYSKLVVEKPKKFLSNILSELALPQAKDTDRLIQNYLIDIIKSFFLRKNLPGPNLDEKTLNSVELKISKFYKSIGINLLEFNLNMALNDEFIAKKTSIFSKSNLYPITNAPNKPKQNQELVDQNAQIDYNKTTEQSENKSAPKKSNVCPVCNGKVIKGSIYCHRCGALLK